MTPARQVTELGRNESRHLVGSVAVGRIVFTSRALAAIRHVYHLRVAEQIITRVRWASPSARLSPAAERSWPTRPISSTRERPVRPCWSRGS
jgi:hypothetical protein